MSMLDPTGDPRALVLSFLNLLMMPVTLFSNSMVTIGKDALLKSVKIDLLDLLQALEGVVEALVVAVDLEEASVPEAAGLADVVGLEVVSAVDAVDLGVVMALVVVVLILVPEELLLPHQTPLPISLLQEPKEARSSMFAM
jgi:hypothetical protein